jgi:hypothetical protein
MAETDWALVWWTFGGAILGPFLAVIATRGLDIWRERDARREGIFVSLMSTRRSVLNPEHVQALSRVELEFASDKDVLIHQRQYMSLLEEPSPPEGNVIENDWLAKRRRRAFTELVHAIATRLHTRVDRLDILEGGYYPAAWAEAEQLQIENLRGLNNILKGHSTLPIRVGQRTPPANAQRRPTPQGFYSVHYEGANGANALGMLLFGGKVFAIESTGGFLGGDYTARDDGGIDFVLRMHFAAGDLITGQTLSKPLDTTVHISITDQTLQGGSQFVDLPIGRINVRMVRLIAV